MLRSLILVISIGFSASVHAQTTDSLGWTFYDTLNHSLHNNMVSDIQFEADGTAWVTTGNMSLSRYKNGKWDLIKAPVHDSMVTGWLRDIAIMPSGLLAITGIPGKLAFYHPQLHRWNYVNTPEKIQFMSISCNEKGVLLLGAMGGLFQYQNNRFTKLHSSSEDVLGINLTANGDALVGFRQGLFKFFMKSDGSYEKSTQFSNLGTYEAIEADTCLWAAFYSGLQLGSRSFKGKEWNLHKELPQSSFYNFNGSWQYVIHNVARLPDGRLSITTQFNANVAILDEQGWQNYTVPIWMRDAVEFDGVECIRIAPDSSIWLGTWYHGVVVLSPDHQTQYPKIKVDPKPRKAIPPPPVYDPQARPITIPNPEPRIWRDDE